MKISFAPLLFSLYSSSATVFIVYIFMDQVMFVLGQKKLNNQIYPLYVFKNAENFRNIVFPKKKKCQK